MPRAEDIRCLHCNGRIPLFRKIKDGQFCSDTHRRIYTAEQERMAVDRLRSGRETLDAATAVADPQVAPPLQWTPELASPEPMIESLLSLWGHVSEHSDWQSDPLPAASPAEPLRPLRAGGWEERSPGPAGLVQMAVGAGNGRVTLLGFSGAQLPEYLDIPFPNTRPLAGHWSRRFAPLHRLTPGGGWNWARLSSEAVSFSGLAPRDREIAPEWAGMSSRPVDIGSLLDLLPWCAWTVRIAPGAGAAMPSVPRRASSVQTDPHGEPWKPAATASPVAQVGIARLERLPLESTTLVHGTWSPGVAPLPAPVNRPRTPSRTVAFEGSPMHAASIAFGGRSAHARAIQPAIGELQAEAFAGAVYPPSSSFVRGQAIEQTTEIRRSVPVIPAPRTLIREFVAPERAEGVLSPGAAGWVWPPRPALTPAGEVPLLAGALLPETFPFVWTRPRLFVEPVEVQIARVQVATRPGAAPKPSKSILKLAPERRALPFVRFWANAPRDLKVMTLALPVLLLLAIKPSLPKVAVSAPNLADLKVPQAITEPWGAVQKNILNRAGVEYSDDFRTGLDHWTSRGDAHNSWTYDAAGFVQPGPLAIYKPSMNLQDYQAQFLGMIDRKALGFVYRAADLENFYVLKLTVLRPGPMPTIGLTRYAVINGKAEPAHVTVLPITARQDMLYRVRLDARGENFAVTIQGTLVDFWSDSRLKTGGVGFFCGKGEEARVRWIQVSHQYDALGRLCAYLAPYNIQTANGSWRP